MLRRIGRLALLGVCHACAPVELDVSGLGQGQVGEACVESAQCLEALSCAPTVGNGSVCARSILIRGEVVDAISKAPIAGAHVAALDERGVVVGPIAVTDDAGSFEMPAAFTLQDDGDLPPETAFTLSVRAQAYRPFPGGPRQAFPVPVEDADAPAFDPALEEPYVVESVATRVELVAGLVGGGVSISGRVEGDDVAGALVTAAGTAVPAPHAVVDADGRFTVFNVQPGSVSLRAYRGGTHFEAEQLAVGQTPIDGVVLAPAAREELSSIDGTLSIVNAPGGSATSVVLVPSEVFDEAFERGPTPLGLRVPPAPAPPSISGAFTMEGVAPGSYRVLAGLENDGLVRDPDASIAGTQIPEITLEAASTVMLPDMFKMTAALELVAPGSVAVSELDAPPTFAWIDDAGEDVYAVSVVDALGDIVWEDPMSPGFAGGAEVMLTYPGPPLTIGMYYQLRVTAVKQGPQGDTNLTTSEGLLGVFVVR